MPENSPRLGFFLYIFFKFPTKHRHKLVNTYISKKINKSTLNGSLIGQVLNLFHNGHEFEFS